MALSPIEIGLILLIVLLIFGGKKLKTLGSDLGTAIKGFRSSMASEAQQPSEQESTAESTEAKAKTAD